MYGDRAHAAENAKVGRKHLEVHQAAPDGSPNALHRRGGYAHVDINNFFASCERVFRPELDDVPVAVLSNNDGCVIARSDQVKTLGVPMGAPLFQWRDTFDRNNVTIFSANFGLYGDMSRRANEVMKRFTPKIEVYSVDEAFLDFSEVPNLDPEQHCRQLINTMQRWTRLPVSVGYGPTKTLAKLGTNWAKQNKQETGCFAWADPGRVDFEHIARETDVGDIWGIGRRYTKRLKGIGVTTVWQLLQLDNAYVKTKLGTTAARTQLELQGERVLDFDTTPGQQKSMLVSRSFGKRVGQISQMESAIVNFASRLSWKLRQDGLLARSIGVFADGVDGYERRPLRISGSRPLTNDSNSSQRLIEECLAILTDIYQPGGSYKRAGVWAGELVDIKSGRVTILQPTEDFTKQSALDQATDTINERYGKGSVRRAVEFSRDRDWKSARKHVSPKYTIEWADVPVVRD